MSTVIVLSSSPPPTFARSPTPALSSPRLASPGSTRTHESPSCRRFKSIRVARDGLPMFSTAKQVLAENMRAKNAQIGSGARNKFRPSQETVAADNSIESIEEIDVKKDSEAETHSQHVATRSPEPAILQRAAARRLDWTPPQPFRTSNCDVEGDGDNQPSFPQGLLGDFNCEIQALPKVVPSARMEPPTKRRRIAAVSTAKSIVNEASVTKLARPKAAPAKRSKSPPKKPLTITSLATADYRAPEESNSTPLADFLAATQAQSISDEISAGAFESKVASTKQAAKKLRESRKRKPKSSLVSPQTAMRSFEDQEAIFGSASQLVKDESPMLLRDTAEAIRRSQVDLPSSPRSSFPPSQTGSDNSTPKFGTKRFKKTRNLWSAADRDEDNALLHVDVVDLTDTPAVRAALTNEDALRHTGSCTPASYLFPAKNTLQTSSSVTLVDIDHIITPTRDLSGQVQQARAYQTTAHQGTSKKVSSTSPDQEPRPVAVLRSLEPQTTSECASAVVHPKPNYAGFSDHDLKKQIKAYGFKALRKREKMVELLNRCWEERYGDPTSIQATAGSSSRKDASASAGYGEFLSTVHDVSVRPQPKLKTAKRPTTRKETTEPEIAPKKPRNRKTKAVKVVAQAVKDTQANAKRSRKKKIEVDEEAVKLHMQSIDQTDPEYLKRLELETFDDWARPAKAPRALPTNIEKMAHAATPPPTLPLVEELSSSPEASDPPTSSKALGNTTVETISQALPTPRTTQMAETVAEMPCLQDQITAAIHHQSMTSALIYTSPPKGRSNPLSQSAAKLKPQPKPNPKRNHNTDPTWHEKILLYDPIILEDLAAWLNTDGLGAVGEDREVSALEVRTWCESRGVCCLWKEGRNGARAGTLGGD